MSSPKKRQKMNSEQTEEKHKKQKTTGMVSFKSKALKYLQSKKIPKTPKKQLLILNPNDTISSTLKVKLPREITDYEEI